MLFNSVQFAIFFPLVFLLYWSLFQRNLTLRNLFIVLTSYVFYGMWDWRFLVLIIISSLGDYVLGRCIATSQEPRTRKYLLIASIALNLGILGFFKYFGFFVDSLVESLKVFGSSLSYQTLDIILPVGISFYTFQTLSYTIDVYNRKLEPTDNVPAFFAFVSFFPQLVAGPIERAKKLLPQFYALTLPDYDRIKSGILLVAFGLFKKIMIADRLAIYVDQSFGNVEKAEGLPMLAGVFFFSFQLYLDFSAYSDIAIGLARTLGFDLSLNFRRPYLANSFSDFWSRWHISLSTWFRDYLYIPLGGNREGKPRLMVNIMIVFFLSGLWHGASWNFVVWGGLNGLFLILLDPLIGGKRVIPVISRLVVVSCWMLSLVFFRAESLSESLAVFANLGFGNSDQLHNFGLNAFEFKLAICLLVGNMVIEYLSEKGIDPVGRVTRSFAFVRYSFYLAIIAVILLLGSYGIGMNDNSFIYFQF